MLMFNYTIEYKKLFEEELYESRSFSNIIKTIKENFDIAAYAYYMTKGFSNSESNARAAILVYRYGIINDLKKFGTIIHSKLKDDYINLYVSGSCEIYSIIKYLFEADFISSTEVTYASYAQPIFCHPSAKDGVIIFKLSSKYYKKVFLTSKLLY